MTHRNGRYIAVGKSMLPTDGGGSALRPTLVVWGTEDKVVQYANNEVLLKHIPHAKLVTIQGVS